jgi:virginiamycin B lyase
VAVAISLALASLLAAAGRPAAAAEPQWFDLASADSFPQGLAAGPDGMTWVANRFASEIERVSLGGVQAPMGLEPGVDPYEIVQGPDGAMWFTEHNGSRIGRLTAAGELSEFPLDDRSTPTDITVGPDGALWFAQRGVSSIGRLTLDGELTEWPTITPKAAPLGITAGPDGALWFTLTTANAIGRITVDGVMTEIPLPSPLHGAQWITTGPDGALWITARLTNTIVRMTVGGGLTEYPIPTPDAILNGITTGPDGAVWFTESSADAVGRIDMHGEIVEIPLGEGASPTGIAVGADGAIWFSAPGIGRVGRLNPVAPPADEAAPVVTIVSPRDGAILTEGEGMIADYSCTDEPGGSGVRNCVGPVADGDIVPNGLGSHTFTVTATDAEGNVGTATHGYVVFDGIGGPITNQAVFSAGRVIPIILELGGSAQGSVFAGGSPLVHAVNCATGETTGPDQAANVQANLTNNGRLLLQWRTSPGWSGSCRSLVVQFGFSGWSSADAEFTLRFA